MGSGPTKGHVARGLLYVLLIEQVKLPGAYLLRTELVWRLVEMPGEIGDRTDIAIDRRRGVIADAEIFQHSLFE